MRFLHHAVGVTPALLISSLVSGRVECGTTLTPEGAAKAWALEEAGAYAVPAGGGPVEVALTFHVVRTSLGLGGIPQAQLDQALVDANTAFAGTGITFCVPGPIDYIDSDEFYFMINTLEEINALRSTNRVDHTINVYFTENLATEFGSICGISSFSWHTYQGIVQDNYCTGLPWNPTTFPHELGHYFDLFHTHETAFGVECADGSNCAVAGDLLCDTPADPGLGGQVDEACTYVGGEVGPCFNDPPYTPDPRNYLSYSRVLCRDSFSAQQVGKGLATLVNLRPELLCGECIDANGNGVPDGCECLADLDGDGLVSTADLLTLLGAWGPNPGHPADLDGDGIVGTSDLLALLAAWGACP
jgi:hypothetical protein